MLLTLRLSALMILAANSAAWTQDRPVQEGESLNKNVLMINPIHLLERNYTISYVRFIKSKQSYRVTGSGSEKENYVAVAFNWNYYPALPAPINYFIGGSVIGYETPIRTGVPISRPFYRFFESGDDEYYLGLQLVNGVLFRISKKVLFSVDGMIGPARNLSTSEWLAIWSVNVNIGISF